MKARDNFSPVNLKVDALDYIFTEWLVRNRLYRKFSRNLRKAQPDIESPRAYIRDRIYCCILNPPTDFSILIEGAFLFDKTPEGSDFWSDATDRWCDFFEFLY